MTRISHYIVSVLMHTAMAAMLWLPATAAGQTAADVCVEPLAADSVAAPDTIATPRPPVDLPEPAVVGIVVRDLATGEDIAARNADTPMTPASIMKCITSACALLDGKAEMRFVTSAFTRGAISEGQLWGDLVIMASGDPTTESSFFPVNAGFADSVASHVAALGIDSIRGQIVFDTSIVPGGGPSSHWLAEDSKWRYGAGHYALNYKDNTLPPDRAMPDPPSYFYDALCRSLDEGNIAVLDEDIDVTGSSREIYRRYSPPGKDIMRSMMVRSDNMFAEAMLRSLAPGEDIDGAVAREKQLLQRLGTDPRDVIINDGSGLARDNRVSPRFMADMLQAMARTPRAADYIGFFPKAGEEGTVRKVLKDTPLAGKLVLKSGSVRGVQCYAGYKLGDSGEPTHAVVIMVNRFTCPRAKVVAEAEKFLSETFLPATETVHEPSTTRQ